MQLRTVAAGLALALPLVTGACVESDQLVTPVTRPENALFARYVAMGNSITAGFQSAGINDSTQRRSYAAMITRASGFPYYYASMQGDGCPAPYVNNVTQQRVEDGFPDAEPCDLRAPDHHPWLSNVAVPGATSFSPVDNLGGGANSNALTTFILGGQTQVEAMQAAEPTLVTAWIGSNDVLGALTFLPNPGNPALVTPQVAFEANYGEMLDAIEATGAPAVLVSVPNVAVIPFASRAAIYYCLTYDDPVCAAPLPETPDPNLAGLAGLGLWTVTASCSPAAAGLGTLVPWPIILTKLGAATNPGGPVPQTLDCDLDTEVVTPAENAGLQAAVAGFNAYIEAEAAARGMTYFDINPSLLALVADGSIPPLPDLLPALAGQPVTFGPIFSLDGVHPSTTGHGIIADSVAAVINRTYGTSIAVPVPR
jgi:lysophospholipase L1-like esterase